MVDSNISKIIPRQFDTYIVVINNSIGTHMFRNRFADVDGIKTDVMHDGWLSCAFFVSTVLSMFKYIDSVHSTVAATVMDLQKNGWEMIFEPVIGSVIVWGTSTKYNNHRHIGFYVGNDEAVSNDSDKKYPIKYHWTFKGKRKVEMILWKPDIVNF